MARIRTIHPDIAQSRSMRRVSRDARLLFKLLLTIADDEGRARARIGLLAMQLFPDDADAPIMLPAWLDELEREACIKRYTVDDDSFLVIVNWRKWQYIGHPTRSHLPAPTKFMKDSGIIHEKSDKVLEVNENEADSGIVQEKLFGSDNDQELTPKDLTRALKVVLIESTAKGKYTSALRSIDMMGKNLGMWNGSSTSAGTEPADTGQNDLAEARAAQKPVGETSEK